MIFFFKKKRLPHNDAGLNSQAKGSYVIIDGSNLSPTVSSQLAMHVRSLSCAS